MKTANLVGIRFGVIKNYLTDSVYKLNIERILSLGGIAIEIEPERINMDGFSTLLSADMKVDLPYYLNKYANLADA